jgi:hypothetical protein
MKNIFVVLVIVVASIPVLGQVSATKHVILSPKSNLDTASVSDGFAKYCPNVVVTENESKADYVLEASSKTTYSEGNSQSHWHFTLLNKDGDVLVTTHPEVHFRQMFKHHFESVCKYINGK